MTHETGGTCASCGRPIIWALSRNGKAMPIDAEPSPEGNLVVYRKGDTEEVRAAHVPVDDRDPREEFYVAHFATCPQAKQWRKKGG